MLNSKDKNVVAIIPARGGSKELPKKNIKILAGKPLIAWSIEAAKECSLVDRVIVSTEDHEIAEVAKNFGAEVPFLRPSEFATDEILVEKALAHTIGWLEENENYITDIVLYLQPTDIFRRKNMLLSVIRALIDDETIDTAFIGYIEHKNYWKKCDDVFVRFDNRGHFPRQKKEHIFREDTGLACATRGALLKNEIRIGSKVCIIPNDETASFIDLHNEFDFWLAEKVVTEWNYPINQ